MCWLLKQVVYCRVTALIEWVNRVTECNLISNYNIYFGHPVFNLMFIILTCLHDIREVRGRRRRKLLDDLKKGEERIFSLEGGSLIALFGQLALEEVLNLS